MFFFNFLSKNDARFDVLHDSFGDLRKRNETQISSLSTNQTLKYLLSFEVGPTKTINVNTRDATNGIQLLLVLLQSI